MAIFFGGGNNGPSAINGVKFNQSKQGYPIPVAMGQVRADQCLIWMDGLREAEVSQGGKGGGKGGSNYLYSADAITALCNGVVVSIGNVWSGQSWLSTLSGNESITVASVYAPQNAAVLIGDNGAAIANTYSQTYTDYGAPASTVLSGTDYAPMTQVPYGTALTTGEYSINPASIGTFTLSAAANASGGNTAYTGTITGGTSPYTSGASNGYAGFAFIVKGFTNAANNGTFVCVASSAAMLTLQNPSGIAETHAGTAADTGNTYHFSSADVGKDAIVNYQFSVQNFFNSETDLVPSIGVINVGGQYNPTTDQGVWYYNNGTSIDGKRLSSVSGTPSAAGEYHFSTPATGSSGGAKYTFYTAGGSGGDFDKDVLIKWGYTNNSAAQNGIDTLMNFELFGGTQSQAVAPYMLSGLEVNVNTQQFEEPAFPGAALGYTNTAYLLWYPMELGFEGEVEDNAFEILTPDAYGGGITDCNPVQCITRVLTSDVWGLGSGKVPFPVAAIDNGSSGTWGGPWGTPGARSTASTAWNWFAANSFFISTYIDSQDTAASIVAKWLEAGQCAAFMSEGLLKLVPYGTQSTAGNGCTWTAPQDYVVALDDTCFLAKEGEDPVKIQRSAWQDGYNEVQVQWKNRTNQYADEITEESDQASINRFGLRVEDPQNWNFITTLPAATFAANMRVKRMTSIRNTYTFSLPFSYSYLEPMDISVISTTSQWAQGLNNVNLGVSNLPVRVTKIVDDPIKGLDITCEDSLFPAGAPVLFNKGLSTNNPVVNVYANPGTSEVVMFEATSRLTGFAGNQIWIGACGTSNNYGGTNVWVSQDGTKYLEVGTIKAAARIGALNSTLALGSDPDTVNSLVVDMAENSAPLEAGSTTDADSGNTMCFVDGEIISYSACTVTGQNQYTMGTYTRRGQMGSTIGSHASDSLFMRLDQSIFKYTYDPTWAGQTLSFKFQPVNTFGNAAPDLSTLTAVSFTVPGQNPGTIDASSGLVLVQQPRHLPVGGPVKPVLPPIGVGRLGWGELVNEGKWTPLVGTKAGGYAGPWFTESGLPFYSASGGVSGAFSVSGGTFAGNNFGGFSQQSSNIAPLGSSNMTFTAVLSCGYDTTGASGSMKVGLANGNLWTGGYDSAIGFLWAGSVGAAPQWQIYSRQFKNDNSGAVAYLAPSNTGVYAYGTDVTLSFTVSTTGVVIFFINGVQVGTVSGMIFDGSYFIEHGAQIQFVGYSYSGTNFLYFTSLKWDY